jgi:hypothetical protein
LPHYYSPEIIQRDRGRYPFPTDHLVFLYVFVPVLTDVQYSFLYVSKRVAKVLDSGLRAKSPWLGRGKIGWLIVE